MVNTYAIAVTTTPLSFTRFVGWFNHNSQDEHHKQWQGHTVRETGKPSPNLNLQDKPSCTWRCDPNGPRKRGTLTEKRTHGTLSCDTRGHAQRITKLDKAMAVRNSLAQKDFRHISTLLECFFLRHEKLSLPKLGHFPARKVAA